MTMGHGELLKVCRHELGLTVRDLQVKLCLQDEKSVRRMESGEIAIHGPTWIAIKFLLREAGVDDLADRIESMCNGVSRELEEKLERKWNDHQARRAARAAAA